MVETTNLEFFIEILYTCNSVFSEIRISSFFHFYSSATNFTPRSSPDLAIQILRTLLVQAEKSLLNVVTSIFNIISYRFHTHLTDIRDSSQTRFDLNHRQAYKYFLHALQTLSTFTSNLLFFFFSFLFFFKLFDTRRRPLSACCRISEKETETESRSKFSRTANRYVCPVCFRDACAHMHRCLLVH